MSFLRGLMGSMDKPPGPDPAYVARAKARREERVKQAAEAKRVREEHEREMTKICREFVKDESQKVHHFEVMDANERSVTHETCITYNLSSIAFGEEGERRIVAFKKAPNEDDYAMMNRALNYEECLADLKARRDAIVRQKEWQKQSAADPNQKVKISGKQAELIKNAALLEAAAPVVKESYGMVSTNKFRADKRTVEEAQNDAAAKKRRRESVDQAEKPAAPTEDAK